MTDAPDLPELQSKLHYDFDDVQLLRQALVHRSYLNEATELGLASNERLEFLGDALLELVVAEELYGREPELSEGEMTRLRSLLVSRQALAAVASGLDLGRYLYMGRGEVATGGRQRPSNLSCAVEAVMGAMFLDGGFGAARRAVLRLMGRAIDRLVKSRPPADDKSRLQELAQARWHLTPAYNTVSMVGPEHERVFLVEVQVDSEVLGRGQGPSKQLAEMDAARAALKALRLAEKQQPSGPSLEGTPGAP